MKKLALLIGLFSFMLLMGFASATPCLQEFANQSTSCGAVAGGSYSHTGNCAGSYTNEYDGNYTTGTYTFSPGCTWTSVYVKPPNVNAGNTTITYACSDVVGGSGQFYRYNFTLPSVCTSTANVTISIVSTQYNANDVSTINCGASQFVATVGNSTADCSDPVEEAITWDIIPLPTITFVSQSPADIDTINLFGHSANMTYNITAPLGIDESNISLNFKTNTSTADCAIYVNGVASYCGFRNDSLKSNISDSWTFSVFDNQVYPAIYNIDETYMEGTAHSVYNLSTDDAYVKIRLLNVSSLKQYSIYEVMTNSTVSTPATALRIYYCNDTYTTGDPDLSTSCTNFYNLLGDVTYNHTHSAFSSHMLIPFAIDNVTGLVNGIVMATSTSYFLLRGNSTDWNVFFISDDTGTAETTTNNGTTWTPFAGTIDSHLHQYDGTDTFWYYVNICDNVGNCLNSTFRNDLLQIGGLPPTAPDVFRPQATIYSNGILINYTISVSPNNFSITSYNISLLNTNNTFNSTIISNNYPFLSYVWDSTGTPDGSYKIKVEACDINSLCAFGLSDIFTVDNTLPNVTIGNPTNNTFSSTTIPIDVSSDGSIILWQYSLNGGSNVTFTPNITITGVEGANSLTIYATDSAGNIGASTIYFTITINPSLISNLGMFGSIALLIFGAGIILFLLEAMFSANLRNPKGIMLIIIGAILMASMLLIFLL